MGNPALKALFEENVMSRHSMLSNIAIALLIGGILGAIAMVGSHSSANLIGTPLAESVSAKMPNDGHCEDLLETIGAESLLASEGARNIMQDAQQRYRKECMNGQ